MAKTATIEAVIQAKDNASATLKNFNSNVQSTGMGIANLAKGIFAGLLAFAGFKMAIQKTTAFVKESLKAYGESEVQMGKVRTALKSMGTSLEENSELFKEAGKSAIRMGFDDEEAALSLTKLYQRTGDMKTANEALAISMDVARFKGVSLEEGTTKVGMALMGNKRILKELGIEIDDTASKEEILRAIHVKLGNQAEEFSKTYEGSMERMRVSIDNVKEDIGKKFAPAISMIASKISDFVNSEQFTNLLNKIWNFIDTKVTPALKDFWNNIVKIYQSKEFQDYLVTLKREFEKVWNSVKELIDAFGGKKGMSNIVDYIIKAIGILTIVIETQIIIMNIFVKTITAVINVWNALGESIRIVRDFILNIPSALEGAKLKGIDFGNTLKGVFKGIYDAVVYWVNAFVGHIISKIEYIKYSFGEIWGKVNQTMIDIYNTIVGWINKLPIINLKIKTSSGSSFQSGTSYVPETGMYMLHQGEAIIQAGANQIRRGGNGTNINVNFYNPQVRNDNDLETIISTVRRTLARDLRLEQIGI